MLTNHRNDQLYLIGVREQAISDGRSRVTFFTTRSDLVTYTRICRGMRHAVIMLGGAEDESGLDSEFNSISHEFDDQGIGTVQVDYRYSGDCAQCAIDTLLVCQYLDDEGITDVALAGWSFGANVALAAGSVARIVRGVAAISPWDVPDVISRRMSAKQLLVLHEGDNIRNDLIEWVTGLFDSTRSAVQTSTAAPMVR